MRITYVGPLSIARVAFVLYGVLGFVFGAILAVMAVLRASVGAATGDESAWLGAIFGVGAVVSFPLFYGGIGALTALVTAWLYNLVAGVVGGVEIRTETGP